MRVVSWRYEDVVILQCIGELESANLSGFRQRVTGMLEGGDVKFVLDTRLLSFINSEALSFLMRFAKQAKEAGGGVVLGPPSKFLKGVLATLKLQHIFTMYESAEKGLLHFVKGTDVGTLDLDDAHGAEKLMKDLPVLFRSGERGRKREPNQVGRLVSLREGSLLFRYGNSGEGDTEGLGLVPGSKLKLKFRQPFVIKDYYFEFDGEVEQVNRLEDKGVDHGVAIRVAYGNMKTEDRVRLNQFVRDQAMWRAEREA